MLDIKECNKCGGVMVIKAHRNVFAGSESIEECYRCGLVINIKREKVSDDSDVYVFRENVIDSFGKLVIYGLNEEIKPLELKKLNEGDYEAILNDVMFYDNNPTIDRSLSFITWWNAKEGIQCLFGDIPPSYDEFIEENKDKIKDYEGFRYADAFFNKYGNDCNDRIPF